MSLVLVTPPSTLPITLAEAKEICRVDHAQEDALITSMIRAALAHAEKWCSRAFEPQVWEEVFDRFPSAEIALSYGPVTAVTSITYVDAAGASQTVAGPEYEADTVSGAGWVVPTATWPATMATINAVRVRYSVGRGSPDDVREAIMQLVAHWYDHRNAAAEKPLSTIPFGTEAILNLHRRLFV